MTGIIKKYYYFSVTLAILGGLQILSTAGLCQEKEKKYTEQQYRDALNQLDGKAFDNKTEPDIDMFISHWKQSAPQIEYGGLILRDILTRLEGDPLKPVRQGAVLQFVNRLSYATLERHSVTNRTTLKDEQLYFYIDKGTGSIEGADQQLDLHSGVGVLIPAGVEFSMRNVSDEDLKLYLISEPVPKGFVPSNRLYYGDVNTMPASLNGHWWHINRPFFHEAESRKAMAVITGICHVWFDPMTLGQPHSHKAEDEEVWFLVEGDLVLLLGKELRRLEPGSAYKIPPNGTTPHSNINVTDSGIKMVWFMKSTPPAK